MKFNRDKNRKLIKWVYFAPTIVIIIVSLLIASVFIYKERVLYNENLKLYHSKMIKLKKIEIKDRVDKVVDQIRINREIIFSESKKNVRQMVDFAYKIIQKIYYNNTHLPKEKIVSKIKEKLRDIRFFDNLTGYFYMYYLDGTCILLPTNPSMEGKNLLWVKDARGVQIIKKALEELKRKDRVFDSWYWYRPGSNKMEKKIGYFRTFKPLGIYIGSAFYVNDIIEKIKKISYQIIRSYRYDEKGYLFAYDYNGVTINHIKKGLIGKNRYDLVAGNRHIVKEMIKGAKINPGGFFINYISTYNPSNIYSAKKISYIKSIPSLHMIVGTGFYTDKIKGLINEQFKYLKNDLDRTVTNIIAISFVMILILSSIMILIARKIDGIILKYEKDLIKQYNRAIEQKRIFKMLFEKSKDGIILATRDKFLDCNEAAVKLFGAKDKKELLEFNILSLSPKYQPDGKSSREKNIEILKTLQNEGVFRGEWQAKRVDGELFWIEVVVTTIKVEGEVILHTVARDITKRKEVEKQLEENRRKLSHRARHDMLTELPNRYMFSEIITHEILRAKREEYKIAVLFMDLDGFKHVNDYYGHDAGDEILKKATLRLKRAIRESDYLFRFGGDEFVLLITNIKSELDIAVISKKIIDLFSKPFEIANNCIKAGISIGIAIYPDNGTNSDELIRNADISMYRAKDKGKNRYIFYEDRMYQKILKEHKIENEIREGIKKSEFILYYQPQIDAKKHKVIGLEALVRWKRGDDIVSPGYFIEIAEQSNLINEIGEIVIDKAFRFAKKLDTMGIDIDRVAVNLADKQLKNPKLIELIRSYLKESGCDPNRIEMELTEGFIMENIEESIKLLNSFGELGFSVSIDDFGTGYSSLAYLKKLPIDVLKIDQSFVKDIPGPKEDEAIVNTIIELAKGLKLGIIAEGIENDVQEKFVLKQGCNIIQGYYYSKPLPEEEVIKFIKNFKEIT